MQLLDVNNKEHQEFTYNILKERANRKNIELDQEFILPSMDKHIAKLNEKDYIVFYIIKFKKIPFAEIYFDKKYQIGMYINHTELKKIIKLFKKIRFNKNRILHDILKDILKKHKKELPYIIAKINSKNLLSINVVKAHGFTSVYECFKLNNS